MTRRRWIADEFSGNYAVLTGDHADHLVRVLRASVGQEFDIVTDGAVRRGRITSLARDRIEFELGEGILSHPAIRITIALAIFKFDRMEWAIEKCTELGVSRILPVIARRTGSHLAASSVKRLERWRRIARQASEQSRRTSPPEIHAPVKRSEILNLEAQLKIVLDETEKQKLLWRVLSDIANPGSASRASAGAGVILAIGPEGGWTDDELQSFHQARWISASLGETVLRAETAAIAATALVASAMASV